MGEVSPPGATLLTYLLNRIEHSLLSKIGLSAAECEDIIYGDERITEEIADSLEKANLGNAKFWNNRQKDYDNYLEKRQ
jgi:plasmid maintenance system antidote protein VapI